MAKNMSLEEFEAFASTLPEGTDRRKLARALNVEIPVVVLPLNEQLSKAEVVKHTPKTSKNNPKPQEKLYVSIPGLQIDESTSTRGFWVNSEVAREVFKRGLELCDKNNL